MAASLETRSWSLGVTGPFCPPRTPLLTHPCPSHPHEVSSADLVPLRFKGGCCSIRVMGLSSIFPELSEVPLNFTSEELNPRVVKSWAGFKPALGCTQGPSRPLLFPVLGGGGSAGRFSLAAVSWALTPRLLVLLSPPPLPSSHFFNSLQTHPSDS